MLRGPGRTCAMDNVTHSVFGYALARVALRAGDDPARVRALTWSAVLASNAPDLDFVAGLFAHDRKLAYLLHHRGYTHTLAVALPLGAAIGLLCARAAGARGRDSLAAAALGGLAGLLHVAFDFLNNYGVHPFVPFDDHWYYGDAVFIVEPLLLSALLPLCALDARTRSARVAGSLLCAALLLLLWRALSPPLALANSAALLAMLALQWRFRGKAAPALWATALVVAVFACAGVLARGRVRAELARQRPGERLLQLSSTPQPGNPLCWSTIAVSVSGAEYHAHLAQLSLLPALIAPARCARLPRAGSTARLLPSQLAPAPGLRFTRELRAEVGELRALAREHCRAAALLRFVRAAYFQRDGARMLLGDLRYDNEPGLGFAEIALSGSRDARCPAWVPPWIPPLQALLR